MFENYTVNNCYPSKNIVFKWAAPKTGFGEFYIYMKPDGMHCESEMMSKEFIKDRLCKMIDDCIWDK